MIKILIADDIEETRSMIKKTLSLGEENIEIVGEASNGEEALKLIPRVNPDVVLMDINMPVLNGLETTEKITSSYPSVIVIIMSVQAENEYFKKAMLYGASEYIIKPFDYNTLIETIKTTTQRHKERQLTLTSNNKTIKNTRIVSFFSSKGGVGKTVLALNTAIALSKEMNKKTLLIDMDLHFGDISIMVNQYNKKTILDAVDDSQIDSYENITPYLHKYNNNLDILFAPNNPESAEYITKEAIEKIMNTFKNYYDIVIADTGINFNDTTLHILDISETIFIVSTTEITSLKNTKLGFNVMESLGYKNKIKLIINKFNSSYGITKSEITESFKEGIFIPDEEKLINISINKGIPLYENYSKSKIGKLIEDICKNLA